MATYDGDTDKDAGQLQRPKFEFNKILKDPNLAEGMTPEQRKSILTWAQAGFTTDKESRVEWEDNNAEAMKMALQVTEPKSEPWDGASNIRFPLISIATLHYHARVYPLMVNGNDPVHCMTYGPDPDGVRDARGRRVGRHMSWQLREQIEEWEEEHDKMLLMQGILGLGIKKSWFDSALRRQRSRAISPHQLVFNYWSTGKIDMYTRATHVYPITSNEIHSMVAQGLWCDDDRNDGDNDADDTPLSAPVQTPMSIEASQRTGSIEPSLDNATPTEMCEQMCWIDLDGDGYMEPYFVTFDNSGVLRRIVARFNKNDVQRNRDGEIISITPEPCYTAYPLIPAPDGSAYPIGFGRLLGPLDDACSTAFNQLFDAGTLANYGGGFLGRGARMRGGQLRIKPGMWQQVDTIGGDLKNNIIPFPNPQPSQTLFALVQYLVQYAERLVSANDLQTGEDIGQNTPAQTAQTMDVNGARIVSAIFTRDWRSFRDEIRTIFSLNKRYIVADVSFMDLTVGKGAMISPNDYLLADFDIVPTADPTVISDTVMQKRDQTVMGMAYQYPNFNKYEATRRFLMSLKVPGIDKIYPPLQGGKTDIEAGPSPEMLKIQDQMQQTKVKAGELQRKMMETKGKIQTQVAKLQAELGKMQAEIMDLQADAILKLSQAKSENEGKEIALINSAIGARKQQMDGLMGIIGHLLTVQEMANDGAQSESTDSNAGASAGAGGSDGSEAMAGNSGNAGVFEGAGGGNIADEGRVDAG